MELAGFIEIQKEHNLSTRLDLAVTKLLLATSSKSIDDFIKIAGRLI